MCGTGGEDEAVSVCMAAAGVAVVDSHDVRGRQRFHHLSAFENLQVDSRLDNSSNYLRAFDVGIHPNVCRLF